MRLKLMGNKIGMTQIFDESGRVTPVTVLRVGPCVVVDKKTEERDGYSALVIEMRLYSSPSTGEFRTDYWADLVTVTAPDYATICFPPEPGSLALLGLGAVTLLRSR